MEDKDIKQQSVPDEPEQEQPDAAADEREVAEVAAMPDGTGDEEKEVVAPPLEGDAEAEQISAEEQAKIIAAQQKADAKYHEVLGDRRIKKPGKFAARVIAAIVIVFLIIFIVAKLPMFYNCMTPSSTDVISNLLELTGADDFGDANTGDRVWQLWYEYNETSDQNIFNANLPGDMQPSTDIFATANADLAENYAQVNLLCGTKKDINTLDGVQYLTVIIYKFDSVEQSRAYGESKAEELGGNHEFKDLWFFKLGMTQAKTDRLVYDAWYNGGTYVEIYCTDADIAGEIRALINYNS